MKRAPIFFIILFTHCDHLTLFLDVKSLEDFEDYCNDTPRSSFLSIPKVDNLIFSCLITSFALSLSLFITLVGYQDL